MPSAETARLIASLELKDQFTPGVNKALGGLGKLDAGISRSSSRAFKAGQQIGTGIKTGAVIAAGAIGFLATQVGFGLRALTELETQTAQTNAVLKSTKSVAGQTAASVRDLANKYEDLNATIDDKVIQSGENLLLTFTNIRKQAFEPALKAALDMNQALGGGEAGLQGTVQKLGKALNDPIKGLTALGRVGITFTKTQQDQIKAAVKAGNTFKAQGIILAELNKRFGGSFLAGGNTTAGKVAKFQDSIEELQKALATALLPTIGKVADGLSKFLSDPQVVKGVSELGQSIAGLFSDKNLAAGGEFLKGAFQTAKDAAPVVKDAAQATFGFVQGAVGLFKSLPPEIQKLAVGAFAVNKLTGGLVTNIAGGIIDTVGKQFLQRGGTPANPLFVADVTGGLGGVGAAAAGGAALSAAAVGTIVASVLAVGVVAKIQSDSNSAIASGVSDAIDKQVAGGATLSDLRTSLAATNTGLDNLQNLWGAQLVAGDSITQLQRDQATLLQAIRTREGSGIAGSPGALVDALNTAVGQIGTPGKKDIAEFAKSGERDIAEFSKSAQITLRHFADQAHIDLRKGMTDLKTASKPADVAKAIKEVLRSIVGKGLGNAGTTSTVLGDLKRQLANTHDPQLQAALRSAIAKVQAKIPGREFAQKQIAKADSLLRDGRVTRSDLKTIAGIERALKDRGLPHAASVIREKVEAAKKAQVAAIDRGTQATKNQDLSVTLNNTVNAYFSARDVNKTTRRSRSFGRIAT